MTVVAAPALRVGCTTLEAFRLFLDPDNEWFTEKKFIDQLLGLDPPSPALFLGDAFGKVLEKPERYAIGATDRRGVYVPGYWVDEPRYPVPFFFSAETMAEPLLLMDHVGGMFEVKATGIYGGGALEVVGKADQLVGLRVKEHKTSTYFDIEKYLPSVQWKFMAAMFDAPVVTYHVFVMDFDETEVLAPSIGLPGFQTFATATVKSIESFNVYPYAGMRLELEALVAHFLEFVGSRGLVPALVERSTRARSFGVGPF